ncbi:hypothetical protein ISF_05306 [Cordyceps fumosorosea ARSEF 2679]|uniref:DUF7907 domain-containing protein n=1 Tax=Cordyceps fumosorosea (strain ARSEF 2679) TaxID=1081104 RepID=A0A167V759_CORFA|nr:hypothetical protein ISF_05306 [Cordyceps fumosorosea ARSEF 2679]OAA62297.1 hypothetical protein ISF_05306 [Cordyceps fumosorosea ARSEF 2679]
MKTAAIATSILASALAVSAQNIQSKPFNLEIVSDDDTVNGKYVGACHSGAAIESLCLTDRPVTMHLNSTSEQDLDNGLLTWLLPSNLPVDSSMRLIADPSSNVAQALFYPGPSGGQYVQFKDDKLTLLSNIDDTQVPIKAGNPESLENWFFCQSYYTSYRYNTLSWVYGKAEPQNPTCVKVSVKRNYEY